MAQGYGRIGAKRRRRGGAWQWLIIGFFPGTLCGGALIFALLLSGLFDGFSLGADDAAPIVQTQVVRVVYSPTPDPNQPSSTPFVVTATPGADVGNSAAPNTSQQQSQDQQPRTEGNVVLAASATPTLDFVQRATQQAQQANGGDAAGGQSEAQGGGSSDFSNQIQPVVPQPTVVPADPDSPIPPQLQGRVTELLTVEGATFQMGTTPLEVLDAVRFCESNGGNCLPEYGEDSNPAFQAQLASFQIERTEVTFQQYAAFLNYLASQGRSHLNGCGGFMCIQTLNEDPINGVITFDAANYSFPPLSAQIPAYAVTWYGANEYCQSIGRRLPTEAEWELAARGTDSRFIYPWGDIWDFSRAQVRGSAGDPAPVAVGTFNNASPYGALDMAGNVAEWVQDWYDEDTYEGHFNSPQPVQDPSGPPVALQKVLRGGSWDARPFFARSVHRQSWFPAPETPTTDYERWIGFRCAADVESEVGVQNVTQPSTTAQDAPPTTTGSQASAQPTIPLPPETDGGGQSSSNRG
jgi:formylglycine-generating enzyme required for sulfatase activity